MQFSIFATLAIAAAVASANPLTKRIDRRLGVLVGSFCNYFSMTLIKIVILAS
jgi:Ca2+/H+ antiporter